jgi:hypothetical protein
MASSIRLLKKQVNSVLLEYYAIKGFFVFVFMFIDIIIYRDLLGTSSYESHYPQDLI